MIADALDNRGRSRVADGEALASNSVEEGLAAGCAIQGDVTDDDVFFRCEAGSARRKHHESAAGEALANVVVGFALEGKSDTAGQECPQALTSRTRQVNTDGVIGQSGRAVATRDFAAEHGADRAVDVADRELYFDRRKSCERFVHL